MAADLSNHSEQLSYSNGYGRCHNHRVNFGNFGGQPEISITKVGNLVEDLDDLCRVAIEYTITVTNSGTVPLENVSVADTILGNFFIGSLNAGQSAIVYAPILPLNSLPRYYITEQNIINDWVNNTATATGTYNTMTVSAQAIFHFEIDLSIYEDIIRNKRNKIHGVRR